MPDLTGVFPIVAIPFGADGSLDIPSLTRQAEYLVEAGASGIGTGLASEIFFLTEDERVAVTKTVGAVTGSSLAHVASVGGDSPQIARERAMRAAEAGARVVMLLPPTFSPLPPDELSEFVAAVAEEGVPIILQDAPGLTGAAMPVEWLAEKLSTPQVVGAKIETSPSLAKIEKLRGSAKDASIFGGGGGLMYPEEFGRGATGCMPGPVGCATFVETHKALQDGDAPQDFWNLVPLLRYMMLGIDLFIWAQKMLLTKAGLISGAHTRIPLTTVDSRSEQELTELAARAGIA